ncbi:alpha/beta fold hydrolase [Candidatus Bipolaricaulota bacterium]|nr:alpha/beta fold hydrolase [Candidatus Bipolaricaulota bacterium]
MEQRFLKTGEGKLRYQTRGKARESPLILLNGVFMTLDRWESFSKELSEDFFVIAHDMRCQGGSFCPDKLNLYDHVNDIISLMDELKVEKASVAGTSYGGEVAQLLALEHPDRVKDLSLITTTSEIPIEMYYKALRWKVGAKTGDARKFTLSFLNDVYSDEFIRENPDILENITSRLEESSFDYSGAVKLLNAFMEIRENKITPRLEEIEAPTQVISASNDRVKPPEFGRKIHGAIENSTYEEVQGSGHGLVVERPKKLLELLKNHLK